MSYFVDHMKKKVHQKLHAGDRCGFLDTPVKFREFTDVNEYIEDLERVQGFQKCQHCQSAQIVSE